MKTRSALTAACLGVWVCLLTGVTGRSDEKPEPKRAGPDWWSLQNRTRPEPPAVTHNGLGRGTRSTPLCSRSSKPQQPSTAPPADRATLIRRVTFDLLGLPPTPAEIDAFVKDPSPAAYEKVIDRLLASPRYGERWGRHWLDVARFGESQGFERDKIRDHAWRYRDYVIRSFNDDKPYDAIRDASNSPATCCEPVDAGRHHRHRLPRRRAVGRGRQPAARRMLMKLRVREEELEDMIGAVSQTFLGLTVNCARCHDHKFDPIPQQDYYRLKAAFEGVRHGDRPASAAGVKVRATPGPHAADARIAAGKSSSPPSSRPGASEAARESGGQHSRRLPRADGPLDVRSEPAIASAACTARCSGGAAIANGRLRLNGKGGLPADGTACRETCSEKTLEAWVVARRPRRSAAAA